jgi:hypothetical protein
MNKSKTAVFLISCSLLLAFLIGCAGNTGKSGENSSDAVKNVDTLEPIVKGVCSSCHGWVPPESLDKATWRDYVIPVMAAKMGIYELDGHPFFNEKSDPATPAGIYPEKPTISIETLRQVFDYFEAKAPAEQPLQDRNVAIGPETDLFSPVFPKLPFTGPPMTTFVDIRPKTKDIVLGVSGKTHRIGLFDADLNAMWGMDMPSAPAWVDYGNGSNWLVTCMGSLLPSSKTEGQLVEINVPAKGVPSNGTVLYSNLPRPVQIQKVNLQTGNDMLVSGFGHLKGRLYFYPGKSSNPVLLKDAPGCIKSIVFDWNKDGKNDVLALFSQGNEGIFLFQNKGNGQFEEKQILPFLPVYGSSGFEIVDFNKDGFPDVVYTCGDNADYSVTLKNFHGVYVFINDGKGGLSQKWFYPVHGAYKALARDFDNDGDLDIASIAFFADFMSQPEESVLYFENKGNYEFNVNRVKGALEGRWLTMDADDLDGDGDIDLVLGNFSQGPVSFLPSDLAAKFSTQQPFMVLYNRKK